MSDKNLANGNYTMMMSIFTVPLQSLLEAYGNIIIDN